MLGNMFAVNSLVLLRQNLEYESYSQYSAKISNYWYLILIPLAVVVIWWLFPQLEKLLNKKTKNSKGKAPAEDLFTSLCRAHSLSPAEVNLLVKMASLLHLKNPSLLFVDPAHYAKLSGGHGANNEYAVLRKKLFGLEVVPEVPAQMPSHNQQSLQQV